VILSENLRQRLTDYATEFGSYILFKELLQVHDWGVILAGELATELAIITNQFV